MSSMTRKPFLAISLVALTSIVPPVMAADPASWDRARAELVAQQPSQMASVIARWEYLVGRDGLPFDDYAGFLLAYPDFPQAEKLRVRAEESLGEEAIGAERLVAFFDRHPPLTNPARARYALALASLGREDAWTVARSAWRGGTMSGPSEVYLVGLYGARLTPDDHDARMDALLWQRDGAGAVRQMNYVSTAKRDLFMARLAIVQGALPASQGLSTPAEAGRDAGYTYNLARHYRTSGNVPQAIDLLANRQRFDAPAFDPEVMVGEMLRVARSAGSDPSVRIASMVDDLFSPGTDISTQAYKLRDDYTSLMWLGGTNALWNLGDGTRAAPLFYRYGAAAQTPQTRSKGFYWAGLAAQRAGNAADAERYYAEAAAYADRFYGQLALAKLGRPVPSLAGKPVGEPTFEQRAAFNDATLTKAVREVARDAPWRTGIQFYREIANSAQTPEEHLLRVDLAREIGRRDLAVNVAEAAGADGLDQFVAQGFPRLQLPPGVDFTFVHAITRQESQFAQNAISHAGARGLMQLMPGTAREQAGKLGMQYLSADLIESPSYNVQLGNGYFQRMLDYYGGSYPLAVAAYNAGPGNVNKWLRANGDPRTGSIDWVTWIEKIPIFETKNYVQRVIENAAVYEHLYPESTATGRPRTAGDFLR
ncbi:lytic transglycosylase domain-containing protein [Erythrobacter sp. SDW2]|uniref:lytic transglycosylase domain-containing protein n=1 Tax=Erythrobacter sp. SDW2 TaxID=2907154 RepID=UPI001F257EA6|nr:lytic transglycosylase domain-containing protein [Erythrobacter sp. SDW2]UIP08139.1 lytic transglycosylase domain-containing protein [Erythrobacter sp. SDW2]